MASLSHSPNYIRPQASSDVIGSISHESKTQRNSALKCNLDFFMKLQAPSTECCILSVVLLAKCLCPNERYFQFNHPGRQVPPLPLTRQTTIEKATPHGEFQHFHYPKKRLTQHVVREVYIRAFSGSARQVLLQLGFEWDSTKGDVKPLRNARDGCVFTKYGKLISAQEGLR